jgi:hypothetical protein
MAESIDNPYEFLAFNLIVSQSGQQSTFRVSAPAMTSECVRAAFHGVLSCGHHIDNVLDTMEAILEEYRGLEFLTIEQGDEE